MLGSHQFDKNQDFHAENRQGHRAVKTLKYAKKAAHACVCVRIHYMCMYYSSTYVVPKKFDHGEASYMEVDILIKKNYTQQNDEFFVMNFS